MEPTPHKPESDEDTMRSEYDFNKMRRGRRGKYAESFRTKEPTVRILHKDGKIEEGLLTEIRKKYELAESTEKMIDESADVTLIAVPNNLVSQVQDLIAGGQQPKG